MELVVFDLDGTLLDGTSQISPFTRETLRLLTGRGIAFTVATGRNRYSAQDIIHGHGFVLPHIYTNGVLVWDPRIESLSLANFLTVPEADHVVRAAAHADLTPFVHTVDDEYRHAIFHPPLRHRAEENLLAVFTSRTATPVHPLQQMPGNAQITNINMLGEPAAVEKVERDISNEAHLVAYSGPAIENRSLKWIDIHHSNASKGNAVTALREQLGITRTLCFGDGDNDLSMFAIADESYAPENAAADIRTAATAVIGHHDSDGVAKFLRERFDL
ncbi:MAG: HAD-IIB family hydrolase [Pseudohongiellaceae bacterium]